MDQELLDFITSINNATKEEEIWKVWLSACQKAGLDVVNYVFAQKGTDSVKTNNLTNLPLAWNEYYQKEKFSSQDYLVKYLVEKNVLPITHDISQVGADFFQTDKQREMYHDAKEVGMSRLLLVPFNDLDGEGAGGVSFGTSSLTSKEFQELIKQSGTLLFAMAQVAHQRLKQKHMNANTMPPISFSPRQQEILKHLASGLTNKEISYRLKVSMPTVSFHLKAIANKLNVKMSREILPKALLLQLVKI